ncbi:hypothetical protein V6N11_051304 [Hibiscus sabdariffa]|uniref:PIG-P domain-containing protein n=1 Tax=Hibiscus sabdariffa TaxID=183260 RepID=A0ABR2ADV5_9ROSI
MSSSPKPDQVTLSLALSPGSTPREARPEERGIRLIQLLLTCAKHASSGNLHRADECLQQISLLASVSGDSMQRLSAWFASALAVRLVKRWPGLHKALNHSQLPKQDVFGQAHPPVGRALPYLGFLYATISRTLIKVMMGERTIHLVDLGSGDANLWIPLIRSFSCLQDEPPHLKITCMNANKAVLENLGPRLVKEAETLNLHFQFSPVNVGLRELTLDKLKVKSGEALAFISILNLHTLLAEDDGVDAHFSHNKTNGIKDSKQMSRFLSTIRTFSPKLFLLVGKEADHNLNNLVDRFVEGLHYYSAVFDSVDATFRANTSSGERLVLEEMYGKEIENIVACEGVEREERHERGEEEPSLRLCTSISIIVGKRCRFSVRGILPSKVHLLLLPKKKKSIFFDQSQRLRREWFFNISKVFSDLWQGSFAVYHKKYVVLDSVIIKRREEKPMEEPHSMNSPRTILSFSKRGRTTTASVSFVDPNDEKSNSGEHGPKPSEVYGFVGSITTVVATAIYLAWAYIPEPWLHSIGIFYYPSRYWALAVPTYAMVIIVLAVTFYIGLNFMSTPPPTSLTTMFDEFSREPSSFLSHMEGDEQPIEPISDLGIDKINVLMFGDAK